MEGISRQNLNDIVRILMSDVKTDEAKRLAGIIKEYDIIPKLYAYTYLKRVHQEMTGSFDENFEDFETQIENLEALDMSCINRNNFKGIKQILANAFDREHYICDFDDTKNPSTKYGVCECESHGEDLDDEGQEPRKQELTLVLMPDEFNKKFDDRTPEYWCDGCADQAEPDVEVVCDMDLES